MRDRLQLAEAEEAARSLDRVDRPENAGDGFLRIRIQRDEVLIQSIKILIAFDQEFFGNSSIAAFYFLSFSGLSERNGHT